MRIEQLLQSDGTFKILTRDDQMYEQKLYDLVQVIVMFGCLIAFAVIPLWILRDKDKK